MIEAGGHVYSNVTVTTRTPTHLFIEHSAGFGSVRIDELSDSALLEFGYKRVSKQTPKGPGLSLRIPSLRLPAEDEWRELTPRFSQSDDQVWIEIKDQKFSIENHVFKGALACLGIAYAIFCHCATLICRGAGLKPGIWCWVPIVQWGFLLKAAGLPPWWVILSFLLVTVVPIWLIWSVKICRARGRGFFTMLLLILPPTIPLGFFSLAWGTGQVHGGEALPAEKVRLAFEDAV